jgi:hypothetical protein
MNKEHTIHPHPACALSVLPVWAWLILHAGKDFENRNWKAGYPSRRTVAAHCPLRIYVHAGQKQPKAEYQLAWGFVEHVINPGRVQEGLAPTQLPSIEQLPKGGLVGSVTVVQWMDSSDSPWATGPGLLLADPEPRPFVPCAGALGFFLPEPLTDKVSHLK